MCCKVCKWIIFLVTGASVCCYMRNMRDNSPTWTVTSGPSQYKSLTVNNDRNIFTSRQSRGWIYLCEAGPCLRMSDPSKV